MQGSTGKISSRGKHPSQPHSARLPRASDYTPLLLPTSTLSSVLESGLSEGLLKDKSSYTSICGQALRRGLRACRQQEAVGAVRKQWELGEGMPDLLAEEACTTLLRNLLQNSFQGGQCVKTPPGVTPRIYLGERKRLGTAQEKTFA